MAERSLPQAHAPPAAGLSFLHAGAMPRCRARVDKRFDYYTVQFMTEGAVELWYGRRRFEMRGAWAWFIEPGQTVRFHPLEHAGSWNHRYAAIAPTGEGGEKLRRWRQTKLWPQHPKHVPDQQIESLAQRMDALIRHSVRTDDCGRARGRCELEALLLQLTDPRDPGGPDAENASDRQADASPAPGRWAATVQHRLRKNLDQEMDYHALAEELGISLSTLRRRFRDATGESMHAWRLRQKIQAARRMLGDTEEPIKRIALQLGYRDVFYFNRHFKQLVGVPPGAYRRSRQG